MKTLLRTLLILGLVMGASRQVWATDLPADATNVREIHIFRNVSGSTQVSGTAYVLQENSTDANVLVGQSFGNESSLGLDVTTTTTADLDDFVGIQIDDTVLDDGLVRLVTYGPAIAKWCGSSDNTNTRLADIGTCNGVAGQIGSGSGVGTLLSLTLDQSVADTIGTTAGEKNGTIDGELRWIWVQPQN